MIRRGFVSVVLVAACWMVSGCLVKESTYLKKTEEATTLSQNLTDLQQRYDALNQDNQALRAEHSLLKKNATQLDQDKQELEQTLSAKSDTLSRSISDLRQKVDTLEKENKQLKEEIVSLQKVKEEKVKEVSGTYEKLLENMKQEIAQGQVTISELKGKLTVNMEAAILFDSGKAEVKTDGIEILLKLVPTLKELHDKIVRIEGHTDTVPIKSSVYSSNWELSAARAINVARYLQQQGLDPALLSATAYSEYKPVADNTTKEGRAKNRRIEISLVAKE